MCLPVVEYIRKNCSPHDTLIITDEQYKIVADEVVVPVSEFGESEDVSSIDEQSVLLTRKQETRQTMPD